MYLTKTKNHILTKNIKKKIVDKVQQNYIYFDYSNKLNLWIEYILPMNKSSTVYKFSLKKSNNIHHFGFYTSSISKFTKVLQKNNYLLINKFNIFVPAFGGKVKTAFFYKSKELVELISKDE
tara:strand:- start:264 stop:629 length:366 start_codon:yes stop_codon:yes gene_type:complete